MTDTPSSILLLRLQSTGSNTNLWGGYLNTALSTQERATKGYQALAVTGDATISWSNYSASNTGAVARLKLTGSLAAAATLTFPAYQNYVSVENSAGAAVTIKCSGGTGVTIANGGKQLIYCDGTDYYSASPNVLGTGTVTVSGRIAGVTAGTASTDAVNKTQMETAIATAGLPATAGTVLVSGSDTTAGYLGQKVAIQSTSLSTTQLAALSGVQVGTSGGDEDLLINAPFVGGFVDGGLQSSSFTPVVGYAYDLDATSASSTVDLSGMTTPQVGQEFKLNKFGSLPVCLLGTVNSNSNPIRTDTFNTVLRYCGASWGWNIMTSSGGGIHFTDPWEFLPRVFVAANLLLEENDGTDQTSATTAFFTAMAARGFQDTTNWTADTYKTLLTVSSGKGFLAALVGPTAGGSETTTFEITADGVTTEIAVAVASGERAVLSRVCLPSTTYTLASRFAIQGGTINAGKTIIGTPGIDTLLGGWPLVEANGVPCLKFTQSLVIRAKHSANITNSTATAYSGGMYRLGL